MTFEELVLKHLEQKGEGPERAPSSDQRLLCFDPGNMTGVAVFEGLKLVYEGQVRTNDIPEATDRIWELFEYYKPTVVVVEDYRIYGWKRNDHAWSELHTAKVVGLIESHSHVNFVPCHKQTAHQAKTFCTDERLKEWRLYVEGKRHARDAIRHGCYYLLFGKNEKSASGGHQVG